MVPMTPPAGGLWSHWSGRLAAETYQLSEKFEYVAVRKAAGIFDTSPLFKYRFSGPGAERFLAGVMARDPQALRPGDAQYTAWSDDRGFVVEDGVLLRHGGCVTGAPGKLAAERIVKDREKRTARG